MRLSDLNTSMLEDMRTVLNFKYVVKSDRDGKREFIIDPTLSWHEDDVEISDRYGNVHRYHSGNVNISTNSLFIYSTDRVIQDMYVGYDTLTAGERRNYDRFLSMCEMRSEMTEYIDVSMLPAPIARMLESFMDSMRGLDLLEDEYELDVGLDTYVICVDSDKRAYELCDFEGDVLATSFSFRDLVYGLAMVLSDIYGFKVPEDFRESVVGPTGLARIYDFATMEVFDDGDE